MDLTSGYPFWLVDDGLIHAYPKLDANVTCDVVVLGGGISGALVAYHLTEAGIETIVVDKRDVACGSTAASTALLQYEIDITLAELSERCGAGHASRAYLACHRAVGALDALAARVPGRFSFARKKSLYLASEARGDRRVLRREWELRTALGLDVEWLEEADVAARFPFRRPAALLSSTAAQVDAYAFTHALLADGCRHGLRVFDRTAVTELAPRESGVTVRTEAGHTIHAGHLVFATGYETQSVLRPRVAALVSTYAVVSEPTTLDGWGEGQCLIWEHARPYLYLRTTCDGRVIVGGEDADFRDPPRRDRLLPKKSARLAQRFHTLFPEIPFEVAFAWTGTFGETKDGLAYIGEHPAWPSSYFALGYGGNGITFSLLAAEIIRDAVLGRPNEDASLFRFGR